MKDIQTEEDIKRLVDAFYEKVNKDELLSPVFNDFARVDWPHHLPKMYQFWNFMVLGIPGYKGQPFPVHVKLPITAAHFGRWLELFIINTDEHFAGEKAKLAKEKAASIAQVFQYKLGLLTQ